MLPQGWPLGRGGAAQGKGQPPGQPLPSGRYLSHRFAGRVSKFFSKYSPPGGRLPPPGALHGSEQQPRDNRDPPQPCPAAGRKPGVCVGSHAKHAWKLRGRGRAPPTAALRLSRVSSRFFGDGMGCFGPFSPAVTSGPFPEWGIFPAALPRRQREKLRISALTHAA